MNEFRLLDNNNTIVIKCEASNNSHLYKVTARLTEMKETNNALENICMDFLEDNFEF